MTTRTVLVVMGVSGTGKSTVAKHLASALALPWIDGDDLHSPQAVASMRAGVALTDSDRWSWLDAIGQRLADTAAAPHGLVVACSALKCAYRDRLRAAAAGLRFVLLHGSPDLIALRLKHRSGHYMPASLLASQLQTLEMPKPSEVDVVQLDIASPVDALVASACLALGHSDDHLAQ